ncbi:hypothetical protein NQ315_004317, partial [Exocentrus adspersus]
IKKFKNDHRCVILSAFEALLVKSRNGKVNNNNCRIIDDELTLTAVMAEAHSAVAFSFAITHEGWDVNFDREVLHLVWQSGVRSWKKRIARFQVSIITCYFYSWLLGTTSDCKPELHG